MSEPRTVIARALYPGIWDDIEYSINVSPGWRMEAERANHQQAILGSADTILTALADAGYEIVKRVDPDKFPVVEPHAVPEGAIVIRDRSGKLRILGRHGTTAE